MLVSKPVRQAIQVHTPRGTQSVLAWLYGGLAVHRTLAGRGWTDSHLKSGKAILSRIAGKDAAVQLATEFSRADCDWSLEDPIVDPSVRAKLITYLKTVSRQPARRR